MDIEVQFWAVGEFKMDSEVQNMDLENSKMSFEVQKWTSERFYKTKMTFKNIPEYSRVILAWFYTIFILFQRKIDEN